MKRNYKPNKPVHLPAYLAAVDVIAGALFWICLILPAITFAQQQTFYSFSYYKILPGKERELRGMLEAVDSKVQQNRVNSGAISSWYLYEVLNPTGSSTEYDYVMISTANTAKNAIETPYTFDSAFKKTFSGKEAKFFTDYYSRQTANWRLVKQEIYAGNAVADSSFPGGYQLKYIMTDFMKPREGKGAQYIKMELDTFRLIHKERIRLGAISQWASLSLMMPYDTKGSYTHLALNYYQESDKLFDFASSKYDEAVKKIFPGVSLNNLFQSAFETVDNTRAELLRLLLYALPIKR
jgi:hypothetical protein